MKFEGIYSAIFTIYDENLKVKKEAVEKLVNYHLENGVKGFYVCGATGECNVLPAKTRMEMLETAIEANRGRGQIMAHIGAAHITETKELLDHANGLEIDAVASLPPALGKYTYNAEEILAYYKWLAKESKHPVWAYIQPTFPGDVVAFAKDIAEIPNIEGVKLTFPDYYKFGKVTELYNGKLGVLNGPDEMLVCGLAVGADGAIGTSYNILPKVAVAIYDNFKAGNIEKAREYQRKLNAFISLCLGHNMGYWKSALTLLGFDMGYTVFPATPVDEKQLADFKEKLEAIGFFNMI